MRNIVKRAVTGILAVSLVAAPMGKAYAEEETGEGTEELTLEEQLQAETEEMEVAWRGEGMGAARPRVGTWRTSAAGMGTHAFVCQVLRQEKQHLQEEREELELEGAW